MSMTPAGKQMEAVWYREEIAQRGEWFASVHVESRFREVHVALIRMLGKRREALEVAESWTQPDAVALAPAGADGGSRKVGGEGCVLEQSSMSMVSRHTRKDRGQLELEEFIP